MGNQTLKIDELAGIEYYGSSGITARCLTALTMLIQASDDIISRVFLLSDVDSNSKCGTHCLLLWPESSDPIVIKSGFSSGYGGEGPRGLSRALQLLIRHNIEIKEYAVDADFIQRADSSCLTIVDLAMFETLQPIRPVRYYGYILLREEQRSYDDNLVKALFVKNIPFSLIDNRIMDLAIDLINNPDANLMTCYRRLEDIIRRRTGLEGESGSKLFSQSFLSNDAPLYWPELPEAEARGRAALFTGVYMAYRNSRAHKENVTTLDDAIREFLLINQLFILENEAKCQES
ncbi:TIGR02391 family protein [Shewanella sp. SM29]|uniref:TIGR02391 family protein n=1 Tax=Shewanella TaxID=22 RepID=UPI0021D98797|nr:TIGR02391 family protein [Shewanella sp. SM29]MCU8075660.1 TIGR02391 family protein [Shewanella sp. SM29]